MPFSNQFYAKAHFFHELHKQPEPLILLNAWDALSAKLFEQAGSKAIATTSAGIAAIFGYGDGQQLPKSLLLAMIERIVHSVNVPVTVDLEAGYGENNQ
jgi:2-methylisocitrate lyase-like PEP mutase family enzyme